MIAQSRIAEPRSLRITRLVSAVILLLVSSPCIAQKTDDSLVGDGDALLARAMRRLELPATRFSFLMDATAEIVTSKITKLCHGKITYRPLAAPGNNWYSQIDQDEVCLNFFDEQTDAYNTLPRGELAATGMSDGASYVNCSTISADAVNTVYQCHAIVPDSFPENMRWVPEHCIYQLTVDTASAIVRRIDGRLEKPAKRPGGNKIEILTQSFQLQPVDGRDRVRSSTILQVGRQGGPYRLTTQVTFSYPRVKAS